MVQWSAALPVLASFDGAMACCFAGAAFLALFGFSGTALRLGVDMCRLASLDDMRFSCIASWSWHVPFSQLGCRVVLYVLQTMNKYAMFDFPFTMFG